MNTKKVVVIAGPSGSGKNTIIKDIVSKYPQATRLVTATTRSARPGEIDGDDYYFFSIERFDAEASQGNIAGQRFVTLFGGVHYGIYVPDLKQRLEKYDVVFAPVDITGAEWLKENYDALTIFLVPESFEEYRGRIHTRSKEMSEREFEMRMKIAENEVQSHAPRYDRTIVNAGGMLAETTERVLEIMRAEGYSI